MFAAWHDNSWPAAAGKSIMLYQMLSGHMHVSNAVCDVFISAHELSFFGDKCFPYGMWKGFSSTVLSVWESGMVWVCKGCYVTLWMCLDLLGFRV